MSATRVRRLTAITLVGGLLAVAAAAAPGRGAVSSAAPAASEAGVVVLEAGGNAADAAVATALALAVVHPAAGNLGGGGFAVTRFGGDVATLDFRETAPAAATPDMFLGADGTPLPEASVIGALAAGVPGSPAGLFELHRRLGRLPWPDVVAPAARLAREGFEVTPRFHRSITEDRNLLARFPETAAVWLPGGQAPAAGSVVRLPRLAAALSEYAERGPNALTTGAAAAAIAAVSGRYGGIITLEDLASYRPVWREPVLFGAFGWQVASMPLPSSGGIILAQTLGILERVGWAKLKAGSADRVHLLAETWRRAYADRFLLGDPATTLASAAQLMDPAWLARRASEIDRSRATPSAKVRPWARAAGGRGDTTHLSVVDGEGNAVSLTTTLNGSYGCGVLVPELGILLNNEMDDFATAPGKPNLYGLIQGEANAVGPGKRMLSSMTPTVAWRGSQVLVLGSPGGSRIPTATAQVFLNVVVDGDALRVAVASPRVHHQWLPDELRYETGALDRPIRFELARRGHTLRSVESVGEVCAVRLGPDGTFTAAADPRGPGAAGTAP
ncbi:MAG: gamma-glutamyltransferase [Acidobacteria bacterium RBG_13_68_16]|nr:MAG: gamma-glutamyltransferase [Acidobacteria bacterium RBG_13_68_16]